MYQIKARYEGVVPLMMDRYYELLKPPKPTEKKTKFPTKEQIEEVCDLKLHKDKKGVFVPTDNIRMMLVGNQVRPGAASILGSWTEKNKGRQYTEMCKSSIWVVGPKDPLKVYIAPHRSTYDDIDERPFLTKSGKSVARKITRRPIINLPWSLSFIIQVTDDQIGEDLVKDLFMMAGLKCGVCAYGPTFGRCLITEWEVAKN